VTYIEEFAFFGCSSLVELVIPKSVTYIEENVLRGCSSLKTLTIPFLGESREAIGADALLGYIFGEIEFKGCKSILQKYSTYEDIEYFISAKLDTVIVTDATKLEYGAFYNCSTFTNILIDGNISIVGQSAFANCRNLQTITIPEGTISLGEYAFLDCDNLGTLTIPSSLTNIEECALSSKKLTNIIINDNNEKYEFIDGALYDNIDKKLVFVAKNYQGEFNIPLGITKIDTEAFYYCENVTKVVIPTSVNEIGDFAFSNCINLTELIIPISVEVIGEGIVYNTNSLASVYVEALTRPNGWSKLWNSTLKPVFWRYLVIPDTKPIITIVPAMEDLNIGRTTQIIPTITNTTDERLTWSSSNTRVATVDILGVVRGLDFGTTVITATSVADSTVSATVEIQVNMEGSGALIVTATKTVLATDNLNEQLSVLSAGGVYIDLSECTYTSADPSVVTITNEGIIQAHSRGTTTVRVTSQKFGIGVIKLTVVD
ncbi:MAG: leucine-rich repeat protein, partial [Bacilli bacterium]|nr:leucine-rich repeat protein [Bacilli bacterium]